MEFNEINYKGFRFIFVVLSEKYTTPNEITIISVYKQEESATKLIFPDMINNHKITSFYLTMFECLSRLNNINLIKFPRYLQYNITLISHIVKAVQSIHYIIYNNIIYHKINNNYHII